MKTSPKDKEKRKRIKQTVYAIVSKKSNRVCRFEELDPTLCIFSLRKDAKKVANRRDEFKIVEMTLKEN